MARTIELITGIAGSGKTAQLLRLHRDTLLAAAAERRFGTALWLAPTRRARQQIRQKLLALMPNGVSVQPRVMTFEGFADEILHFAPVSVRPLTPAMQRVLLRRLIDRWAGGGPEEVGRLGAAADTSGFLDVVQQFIAELKREEIWPEAFLDACDARRNGVEPRDRALARIYADYQAELVRHQFYDLEGRFWSALQQLEAGHWGPLGELELVIAGGFTDFTHSQYGLLRQLAGRCARLIVSLNWEPSTRRLDLLGPIETTMIELEKIRPLVRRHVEPPPESAAAPGTAANSGHPLPPGLAHVARELFVNPRSVERRANAEGIELLLSTAGLGEVRTVAARIKRLLLDGVAPGEIVIAVRNVREAADLYAHHFADAGIPLAVDVQPRLALAPLVRALALVLRLEAEDWPFALLISLLTSPAFRPDWPENTAAARADVNRRLREARIHVGREAILRGLESCSRAPVPPAAPEGGEADQEPNAPGALELLRRLSEDLAALRQPGTFSEWIRRIAETAAALGLLPPDRSGSGDPRAARDRQVWQELLRLLHASAAAMEIFGDAHRPIGLKDFLREWDDLVRSNDQPRSGSEEGKVRLLSASQVRGIDVEYLVMAGLGEGAFPNRQSDGCLYTDVDREELRSQGLRLGHRELLAQQEMLLFYGVATRARKTLILSCPTLGPRGQPMLFSPFLAALLDLFEPGSVPVLRNDVVRVIPPDHEITTAAACRIRAVWDGLHGSPGLLTALAARPATAAHIRKIRWAAEVALSRFQERGFDRYEGWLAGTAAAGWVQRKLGSGQEWSATQLEQYGRCPFRFFATELLGVAPQTDPAADTDRIFRGTVLHDALETLHRELARNELSLDRVAARLADLLRQRLAREDRLTALQHALLEAESDLLGEFAAAYADQLAEYLEKNRGAEYRLLEARFGHAPGSGTAFPSLLLSDGADTVEVCGKIDRVDFRKINGRDVYVIIDYKSGSMEFSRLDVESGLGLQLVLYALAVEQLKLLGGPVQAFSAGYWSLKGQGYAPAQRNTPFYANEHWQEQVAAAPRVAVELVRHARRGEFPVYSPMENCTRFCPLKTACRVNQIRPLEEPLLKVWRPTAGSVRS